jgi:hypothetical protein
MSSAILEENHLAVSASKTKVIQIHTHQTHYAILPKVQINNLNVDIASVSSLLGVEICETMNWSSQCEKFPIKCVVLPICLEYAKRKSD